MIEPLEIRIEPNGPSTPKTGLLTSEGGSPTVSQLVQAVPGNGSVDIERLQGPSTDRSEQVSSSSSPCAPLTSVSDRLIGILSSASLLGGV